jgi:hypothetical protein
MAKESRSNLFRRLTKLFRSGPVIKRKVKNFDTGGNDTASAFDIFRKNQSQAYSAAMSAYGAYDRMARYSDFAEMEYTPEIAGALDIYAEEAVSADEHGKVLHVMSENPQIKKLLEEMFYDTLNIEFNLTSWARNLVKYGDMFLFNDVHPKHGVINAFPLPISEIEREEGYDPKDPMAVRFRWVTQGNQILENWQVSHMRLLGNDAFLPYGSSILEPARRIWRQMILLEDAMMVFRVVRAPARRIFYIDVGNVPPEEIPNYMEQAQTALKRSSIIDRSTGRVDLRYNPLSIDEDYFIPRRGTDTGTEITELAGQQTAGEINDVEYIQKKLFAALKVPKAYLGYEEGLGSKATLSQQDVRFARSVARIQRTILAELNKLAIIHLYCNGYTGEDLLDFNLQLSTASTIAQLQKLELFTSRFTAASTAQGLANLVDRRWIQKNILRLSDEEVGNIDRGLKKDKIKDLELDATQLNLSTETDDESDAPLDFDDEVISPDIAVTEEEEIEEPLSELNIADEDAPVKVANRIDFITSLLSEDGVDQVKEKQNKSNQATKERLRKKQTKELTGTDQIDIAGPNKGKKDDITGRDRELTDLTQSWKKTRYDEYLKKDERDETFLDEYLNNKMVYTATMNNRIESTLKSLDDHINSKPHIISENNSNEEEDND